MNSLREGRKFRFPQRSLRKQIPSRSWLLAMACSLLAVLSLAQSVHARKRPPAHPIDLNTATAEQLQQVPGIGPETAKEIIAFREKSGPFRRVEDLLSIRRISRARFNKFRAYLTVAPRGAVLKPVS